MTMIRLFLLILQLVVVSVLSAESNVLSSSYQHGNIGSTRYSNGTNPLQIQRFEQQTTAFSSPFELSSKYVIDMIDNRTGMYYQCYNNLSYMHEVMNTLSYTDDKVFHLCPNTIYKIGECCDDDDQVYINNRSNNLHYPIFLRGNTKYICGYDGSNPYDDQCIIYGNAPIRYRLDIFGFEMVPLANVELIGLTFQENYGPIILLSSVFGDILFERCIFRDGRSYASIVLYSGGMEGILVDAKMTGHENDITQNEMDQLRSYTEERIYISMNNCSFLNHSFPYDTTLYPGNMYAGPKYHSLSISNSYFINNSFADLGISEDGWAMKLESGNKLSLENNCFFDNKYLGNAIIIVNNTNITSLKNNYAANNGDIICPFLYSVVDNDNDDNKNTTNNNNSGAESTTIETCIPPDATSCIINGIIPLADIPAIHRTAISRSSTSSVSSSSNGQSSGIFHGLSCNSKGTALIVSFGLLISIVL